MRQRWRGNPPIGRGGTHDDEGAPYQFPKPEEFAAWYEILKHTFGGHDFDAHPGTWREASPEQREAILEKQWKEGGLRHWAATFTDATLDEEANDAHYDFWAKKVRARLTDPRKRDLLAPLKKPHAWGTKRPSLEQNLYEVLDQPHMEIVNIKDSPIDRKSVV